MMRIIIKINQIQIAFEKIKEDKKSSIIVLLTAQVLE